MQHFRENQAQFPCSHPLASRPRGTGEVHGYFQKVGNVRLGVDDRSMLDIRVVGNKVRDEGEMMKSRNMRREKGFVVLIWSIRCQTGFVDFTNVLNDIDEGFSGEIHRKCDVVRALK